MNAAASIGRTSVRRILQAMSGGTCAGQGSRHVWLCHSAPEV